MSEDALAVSWERDDVQAVKTFSALAAQQLRAAGFTVYDLDGGFTAWQAAGKPVVK